MVKRSDPSKGVELSDKLSDQQKKLIRSGLDDGTVCIVPSANLCQNQGRTFAPVAAFLLERQIKLAVTEWNDIEYLIDDLNQYWELVARRRQRY